jgi:hypothetical protein
MMTRCCYREDVEITKSDGIIRHNTPSYVVCMEKLNFADEEEKLSFSSQKIFIYLFFLRLRAFILVEDLFST